MASTTCAICQKTVIYRARDSSMALTCSRCRVITCCDCAAQAALGHARRLGSLEAGFERAPCPACGDGTMERADAPPPEDEEVDDAMKIMAVIGAVALGITGAVQAERLDLNPWVAAIGGAIIGGIAGLAGGFFRPTRYAYVCAVPGAFVGGLVGSLLGAPGTGALLGIAAGAIGGLVLGVRTPNA